jgi:DNA-directed RNA polymerase specialized sigma24 family protein
MKAMTEYSEHIRAQALAALMAGQTFSEVSRAMGVPIGTLKSWKQRSADVMGSVASPDASAKKERIGALLLDYLVTTLETLAAQQRVFANEEWLLKQSASELAVLHGVSVDKAVRLLEGLAEE